MNCNTWLYLISFCMLCISLLSCELEKVHVNTPAPLTFEKIPYQISGHNLYPYEIIEDNGTYAVCGQRYDQVAQMNEGFLFRIDTTGVLRHRRWEKAQIYSMAPIELGYMTTGYDGQASSDYRLFVKSFIEVNGRPYEPDFGEQTPSVGYDLIQTSDGNFLVAGYTMKNNDQVGLLLKLEPFVENTPLWRNTYTAEPNEFIRTFYFVEEQPDGSLIVFDGDRVLYMDAEGSIQNTVTLENFFSFGAFQKGFQITQDGQFLIARNRNLSVPVPSELILFNTEGEEMLRKTYRDISRFESLRPTTDGGFVICGGTREYGNGGSDAFLLKVDVNLNEEWFRTYGGALDEKAYDAIQTSDGGFIIVGTDETITQSDALEGDQGLYLIKTDAQGMVR